MKVAFVFTQWKFIIHLLFKTRFFGVNNQWRSTEPSMLSWTVRQRLVNSLLIIPIVRNYQAMRFRSFAGWIPKPQAERLFSVAPEKEKANG